MTVFTVGKECPLLAGRPEGTYFDITDNGPLWCFNYMNPTKEELDDVSAGSSFEIRSMVLYGILWIFVRCGTQQWAEAPFDPRLCKKPFLQEITNDSDGYGLMLLLIDAQTSILRHIRLITLGNKFSKKLREDLLEILSSTPEPDAVQRAQARYSTSQMVAMCRNSWRSNNG